MKIKQLLNNQWIKEEIWKENLKFLETTIKEALRPTNPRVEIISPPHIWEEQLRFRIYSIPDVEASKSKKDSNFLISYVLHTISKGNDIKYCNFPL
jgi:hypothetical protein